MKTKILVLAVSMVLFGCMSTGTKVDASKSASFEKGKSTSAEVIAALGQPQSVGTQSDGKKLITYAYSSATPNAASFIPFVGLFAGKTKGEVSIVTFTFSPDDKLENYVQTVSNSTYSMGAVSK